MTAVVAGLARASHPLPALAVTTFGTALGLAAALDPSRAALLAAALLTGQLSIGWANDAVDAGRDAAAGRTGKPVVAGLVSARAVWRAAWVAAAVCVPLSLALGAVPGAAHLVLVASGWSYDLALKGTPLSPLPYAVAFSLLPVVPATAAGGPVPVLLAAAAGVLAAAAHFANTVPDADADALTGVRGLPQRLGPRRSRWVAAGGVVAACGLLLLGAWSSLPAAGVALLAVAAVLGAAGGAAGAFRLVLLGAAVAVAGVVTAGPALLHPAVP